MKNALAVIVLVCTCLNVYGDDRLCADEAALLQAKRTLSDGYFSTDLTRVQFNRLTALYPKYLAKFGFYKEPNGTAHFPRTAAELNSYIRKYNRTVPSTQRIRTQFYPDFTEGIRPDVPDELHVRRFAQEKLLPINEVVRTQRDHDLYHALEHLSQPAVVIDRAAYNMKLIYNFIENPENEIPARLKQILFNYLSGARLENAESLFTVSGKIWINESPVHQSGPLIEDFNERAEAPGAVLKLWNEFILGRDFRKYFYSYDTVLQKGLKPEIGPRLDELYRHFKPFLTELEGLELFNSKRRQILSP